MPLIEGNDLRHRFSELLAEARKVDIAVAWANSCYALEALHKRLGEGTAMRIAVGISGNVTCPKELRRLQKLAKQKPKLADLRIAPLPKRGIFHPKYFCFHGPTRTIYWVGSANLTKSGFDHNDELVHEFEDSTAESRKWFESLWNKLDPDPGRAIDDYEKRWEPPTPNVIPEEVAPPASDNNWEPLSEYDPPPRTPCPAAIQFWDGSIQKLKYWNQVLLSVVEKLYTDGRLTVDDLPIQWGDLNYCVHTKPVHPNGKRFRNAKSIAGGELFVDGGQDAVGARRNAKRVLEQFGKNPAEVSLQVAQ